MDTNAENLIHTEYVRPAAHLFDGVFGIGIFPLHPKAQGYVPTEDVKPLTFLFVDLIAEVLQSYLDAGSERDVTHEDETLYAAIHDAIAGWQKE